MVKYPQEEKKILLDRWNASIASLQELRKQEKKVPTQFGLSLQTVGMKTQYREGEAIVFSVTAEKDCYLLLVDHMLDGTSVMLFPNRFHPDCFIKKGQTLLIPSPENETFKILVGPPFGDDLIEAIASTQNTSLHATYSSMVSGLPSNQDISVTSRGLFVKGLVSAVASTSSDSQNVPLLWSRAEVTISTFQK